MPELTFDTVHLDRSGEISNLHPREYGISPLRFATVEMTNGLVSGSVEMNGWWRSLGAVISTEVERSLPECLRAWISPLRGCATPVEMTELEAPVILY